MTFDISVFCLYGCDHVAKSNQKRPLLSKEELLSILLEHFLFLYQSSLTKKQHYSPFIGEVIKFGCRFCLLKVRPYILFFIQTYCVLNE